MAYFLPSSLVFFCAQENTGPFFHGQKGGRNPLLFFQGKVFFLFDTQHKGSLYPEAKKGNFPFHWNSLEIWSGILPPSGAFASHGSTAPGVSEMIRMPHTHNCSTTHSKPRKKWLSLKWPMPMPKKRGLLTGEAGKQPWQGMDSEVMTKGLPGPRGLSSVLLRPLKSK